MEPSASDGRMKAELLLDAVHNHAADNSERAKAPLISLIDRSTQVWFECSVTANLIAINTTNNSG